MHIKQYIKKIVEEGDKQKMEELSEMLEELICDLKDYDYRKYSEYRDDLYIMANGEELTEEMAKKWVNDMNPPAKWTMEETNSLLSNYGLNLDKIQFYVVMNMMYSDMKNILGEGNDEQSIKKYIEATKDWLNDEDIGKGKLFKYYMYVVK